MSNRRFLFSGSGNGERLKFYPNMKAIIAEKPSVGMDIARVVGATEKRTAIVSATGIWSHGRWGISCRWHCPAHMATRKLPPTTSR